MTHPQTEAPQLKALLAKVEAGEYDRGDGETKRYSAFYDDALDAGCPATVSISKLMDALHNGNTSAIRALISAPVTPEKEGE